MIAVRVRWPTSPDLYRSPVYAAPDGTQLGDLVLGYHWSGPAKVVARNTKHKCYGLKPVRLVHPPVKKNTKESSMNAGTTTNESIELHESEIKRLKKQRKAERKRAKARKAELKERAERRQLAIDTYSEIAGSADAMVSARIHAADRLLALDA